MVRGIAFGLIGNDAGDRDALTQPRVERDGLIEHQEQAAAEALTVASGNPLRSAAGAAFAAIDDTRAERAALDGQRAAILDKDVAARGGSATTAVAGRAREIAGRAAGTTGAAIATDGREGGDAAFATRTARATSASRTTIATGAAFTARTAVAE